MINRFIQSIDCNLSWTHNRSDTDKKSNDPLLVIDLNLSWNVLKVFFVYFVRIPTPFKTLESLPSCLPQWSGRHSITTDQTTKYPLSSTHQASMMSILCSMALRTIFHHYNDVISSRIIYSAVYSGANQRKHQSPTSLAFVRGIHPWLVNSPHKGPITREMFPFDDVTMCFVFFPDCDFTYNLLHEPTRKINTRYSKMGPRGCLSQLHVILIACSSLTSRDSG